MTDHSDLVHHSLAFLEKLSELVCLPPIVNLIAALRISLKVMVLVEEGVETTLIEEEEEVDAIIMEVSLLLLKHLRITLLRVIKIKIPLKISKLKFQHARFVENQDIKL